MEKESLIYKSPLGDLELVASEKGLTAIHFLPKKPREISSPVRKKNQKIQETLKQTKQQLREYFAGQRSKFEIPLSPEGTPFQQKAWKQLQKIPYGKTVSYQEQAKRLGNENKCRAVGGANGKNPIPFVIPCHRVVNKNGQLGGFGLGLPMKEWLLYREQNPSLSVASVTNQSGADL